jgi:uncharacterized protein (TIGR02453 family)
VTTPATRFEGFPAEAFDFYEALSANNTKPWWNEHKADYLRLVREPLAALLDELSAEFGTPHIFRPYRDARFSKDPAPVKDHQGGTIEVEDAIAYYVQVSANGLMLAGGWWSSAPMQLARYREAAGSAPGAVLEKAIAAAEKGGLTLGGDVMKTRPRGVAEDHPRVDLLRHRSLTVERQVGTPTWVSTRKALTHVQKTWRAMTPLVEWLTDHVGPVDDGVPPEPR